MGQAIFSVRMDEDLKKEFEELCNDFGMNMTTAINVFAKAVVRERKIPFEIKENKPKVKKENISEDLNEAEKEINENGTSSLTLDDIIAEIEKFKKDE